MAQGDVVIVDTANLSAFTTTTTSAYNSGRIGVVLEPNGIANNGTGLIAFGGYVPVINLSGTGTAGDIVKCHSVAKQGVRHAAPQVSGDFAQVLGTSATPSALLFGSVQLGGGSGVARSGSTTNLDLAIWDGNNADSIKDGGTFASQLWGLTVNESGASFTNWTSGSGTWSSDGTVIKQTDTAGTWRTAKYNTTILQGAGVVFEANAKLVSAGGSATLRALGLVVGYGGVNNLGGIAAGLRNTNNGTKTASLEQAFTAVRLAVTNAFAEDTFIKLRLVSAGGLVSLYVDGTLQGNAGNTIANSSDARYIGLVSIGCEAHFKDIKAWVPPMPA